MCLLRQIATAGDHGRQGFSTLGGDAPASSNAPTPAGGAGDVDKKVKKKPNTQKVVQGKIAMLSTKVSEIMAWTAKVKDSSVV